MPKGFWTERTLCHGNIFRHCHPGLPIKHRQPVIILNFNSFKSAGPVLRITIFKENLYHPAAKKVICQDKTELNHLFDTMTDSNKCKWFNPGQKPSTNLTSPMLPVQTLGTGSKLLHARSSLKTGQKFLTFGNVVSEGVFYLNMIELAWIY